MSRLLKKTDSRFVTILIIIWLLMTFNNLSLAYLTPPRMTIFSNPVDGDVKRMLDERTLPPTPGWVAQIDRSSNGPELKLGIYAVLNGNLIRTDIVSGRIENLAPFDEDESPIKLMVHSDNRFIVVWVEDSDEKPGMRLYDSFSDGWVEFEMRGERRKTAPIQTAFPKKLYRNGNFYRAEEELYVSQFVVYTWEFSGYAESYYSVFDIRPGEFYGYGSIFRGRTDTKLHHLSEDKSMATFAVRESYDWNILRPRLNSAITEYTLDTSSKRYSTGNSIFIPMSDIESIVRGPDDRLLVFEKDCVCSNDEFKIWIDYSGRSYLLYESEFASRTDYSDENFFDEYETVVLRLRTPKSESNQKPVNKLFWFDYQGRNRGIIYETDHSAVLDFVYLTDAGSGVLCYPTGVESQDNPSRSFLMVQFYDVSTHRHEGILRLPLEIKHPIMLLDKGDYYPKAGEMITSGF